MSYIFITGPLAGPPDFPSNTDIRISEYWVKAKRFYKAMWNKAVQFETFGTGDPAGYYDRINDLHYLLFLLWYIYSEKAIADAVKGCVSEVRPYRTAYALDCIADHFKCYGIDAETLYAIFGLKENCDGIGCMVIGGASNPCNNPPFKIT